MKNIREVRYYLCSCSKCGLEVQNKEGYKELKNDGWVALEDDLLCPDCAAYYKNLNVMLEDEVVCLIDDQNRQLNKGKRYIVCDMAKAESGSIYVSCGNGWQSKLCIGEYDI